MRCGFWFLVVMISVSSVNSGSSLKSSEWFLVARKIIFEFLASLPLGGICIALSSGELFRLGWNGKKLMRKEDNGIYWKGWERSCYCCSLFHEKLDWNFVLFGYVSLEALLEPPLPLSHSGRLRTPNRLQIDLYQLTYCSCFAFWEELAESLIFACI